MKKKIKRGIEKEWKDIAFNILFATIAVLIIIFLYKDIAIATFFEVLLGVTGLVKWRSKITLAVFIIGGILGSLIEMIIILTSGAWTFTAPNILNTIPLWLIVIWANISAFIYETTKELQKIGIDK